MKTKIMMLSLAALIVSAGLAFGRTVKAGKLDPQKFQQCQEFTIKIDAARTLATAWKHYDEHFSYIDSALSDQNFPKDIALQGDRTIVIYRLQKSVTCEEAIAFADQEGLGFIDAPALADICTQQNLDIQGNTHGVIAVNRPENLYHGQGREYLVLKYAYLLVPYVAYSYGQKQLGVGSFGHGCRRGDYLIFYKKSGPPSSAVNASDNPKWIESVDEFRMDIPADRSLDRFLSQYEMDCLAAERDLTDMNYCLDSALTGLKTIHVCKLKSFVTYDQVRSFVKKQNGQLPDAQTVILVFEKRFKQTNYRAWMIGVIDTRFAPEDRAQVLTWGDGFSPYSGQKLARESKNFVLDIGRPTLGCRAEDYFIYLTDAY